jgi:transcriptional regulator with XRE-family HTH domain
MGRNVGLLLADTRVLFATNLDRLMTLHGMRNAALARAVGVSRQMISHWRQGRSIPSDEYEKAITNALHCRKADLYTEINTETPPMVPIAEWAKRECIPIGRAKSLFDLGILSGSTGGAVGELHLVPIEAQAPTDSKHVVRAARRPSWVAAFAINLDHRMRLVEMSNAAMGVYTGVGQCAVTHWRSGRGYPLAERLPLIAERLVCKIEELLEQPTSDQETIWLLRYKRAAEVDTAFAVNIDWRMRLADISNAKMAAYTNVLTPTVLHWRRGRSALPIERLPLIVTRLGCTIEEILREPSNQQIKEWAFRYEQTNEDRAAAA